MSLVDQIPRSIKEIGLLEARGAEAKGQYGQSIADIGQMIGRIPGDNRRRQSEDLRLQADKMQIERAKREDAADLALQNAVTNSLLPDGSIDANKLTAHLAGTPAASQIPTIVDSLNRLKEGAFHLQSAAINAQEAEDDALGAIAFAASQAGDPDSQAAILASGLASGVQLGTIRKQTGNGALAEILGSDGNPIPEKVQTAIKAMTAKSGKQRTLSASEAQKRASEENLASLKEDREARATDRALANYANHLAGADNAQTYAQRYRGIPAEMQGYFDPPESWTPESSRRAAELLLTPAEREAVRMHKEAEADRDATERQREREHKERLAELVRGHDQASDDRRYREDRLREGQGASGADAEKATYAKYQDFVKQYDKAQDEFAKRPPMVYDKTSREKLAKDPKTPEADLLKEPGEPPVYMPPPAFEKWQAMTTAERADVIRNPKNRIDDAEMTRRGVAASPAVPSPGPTVTPNLPAYVEPTAGQVQVEVEGVLYTFKNKAQADDFLNKHGYAPKQ